MVKVFLCFVISLLILPSLTRGQIDIRPGIIRGYVKDSISEQPLPLASVTAYRAIDSAILSYQLAGNNGGFTIRNLPLDTPFTLSISFVGYKRLLRSFKLSKAEPEEAGNFFLSNNGSLKELVITAERPPLRMKGDTLEINPSAFKSGQNAVVEDMLKKVPGITIWGDGQITINGNKVVELLVDGKPFFSENAKIATQNLPQEAIDKVQVYQTAREKEDRTMNLVLKKNRRTGYFGKAGLGVGTMSRHEGTFSLNNYKPGEQLSLLATLNNTNKVANSIEGMMEYNTFRPSNTSTTYQSDFSKAGTNDFISGGFKYSKDFSKDFKSETKYFGTQNVNRSTTNNNSLTFLGDSSLQFINRSISRRKEQAHQIHVVGAITGNKSTMNLNLGFNLQNTYNHNIDNATLSSNNYLNEGYSLANSISNSKAISSSFNYIAHRGIGKVRTLTIDHSLLIVDDKSDRTLSSNLTSRPQFGNDSLRSNYFNRKYLNELGYLDNSFNLSYNVNNLVQRLRTGLLVRGWSSNFNLINLFNSKFTKRENIVNDFNNLSESYDILQISLTNTDKESFIKEEAGWDISFSRLSELANRYRKQLDFTSTLKFQMQYHTNLAEIRTREISRNYSAILPAIFLRYKYSKSEKFTQEFKADYETSSIVPSLNDLTPLVDSTELFYLRIGNITLRDQYQHLLTFNFRTANIRRRDEWLFKLQGQLVERRITENITLDDKGRQIVNFLNGGNYYLASVGANYTRSIKLSDFGVNIHSSAFLDYQTGPAYIAHTRYQFKNISLKSSIKLNCVVGSYIAHINHFFNSYLNQQTLQQVREQRAQGATTTLGLEKIIARRFRIESTSGLLSNSGTYLNTASRILWNCSLSYRFLKNEQLELKVSANDIFNQNLQVITTANQNTINQSETNRIGRFCLFQLGYYPRKFGNNK